MKDTIEERMLNVQRAKSALGKGTMVKLSAAEESLAKVTSLKDLFQIKSGLDDDAIDTESNDWY
jgi:SNF2 family DNA or RNA helicase